MNSLVSGWCEKTVFVLIPFILNTRCIAFRYDQYKRLFSFLRCLRETLAVPVAITEFPDACALDMVHRDLGTVRDVKMLCYWEIRIRVTLKSHTRLYHRKYCAWPPFF